MLDDLDDTEETELADGRCARKTDMKVRFETSKIRGNYEFLRRIIGVILNLFSGMCRRRNGHLACGETRIFCIERPLFLNSSRRGYEFSHVFDRRLVKRVSRSPRHNRT